MRKSEFWPEILDSDSVRAISKVRSMQIGGGRFVLYPEHQPSKPYLLFHPNFIFKVGNDNIAYRMPELLLKTDAFKRPAFAIDVECRKFWLKDVVKRRTVYAL